MKTSICIPCYEMGGKGHEYLNMLLDIVSLQRGVMFDVVVSDQSTDDKVRQTCDEYEFVKYHKFDGPRNPCDNLNNAIELSDGEVIKILFQDDFFFPDPDSLFRCVSPILEGRARWTACTTLHTKDGTLLENPIVPVFHEKIHYGKNTMSSPSIISVLKEGIPRFDPNLSLYLDVDWYKRVHGIHGDFHLVKEPCVVNRLHPRSLSSHIDKNYQEVVDRETKYVSEKYGDSR